MIGYRYKYVDSRPVTVVWMPEPGIQLELVQKGETKVIVAPAPVLPPDVRILEQEVPVQVPYPVLRAAREYLRRASHVQPQMEVLRKAMHRQLSIQDGHQKKLKEVVREHTDW